MRHRTNCPLLCRFGPGVEGLAPGQKRDTICRFTNTNALNANVIPKRFRSSPTLRSPTVRTAEGCWSVSSPRQPSRSRAVAGMRTATAMPNPQPLRPKARVIPALPPPSPPKDPIPPARTHPWHPLRRSQARRQRPLLRRRPHPVPTRSSGVLFLLWPGHFLALLASL
jgi:hypothetical protein